MRVKRIDYIKDYIKENKSVSIDQLCEVFQVSKNTIRRDIDVLVKEGGISKVYGGVVYKDTEETKALSKLLPFAQRNIKNNPEKNQIAQSAAQFVTDGETIFLDSGTTTLNMIPYLAGKQDITVITYSIPALIKLLEYESIKVISLPGILLRGTSSLIGNSTTNYLSSFNITKAFMACTGISLANGVTNATFEEYEVKKTALLRSKEHFLLADHDKFNHAGVMTYAQISDFQTIITDSLPSYEYQTYCKENQVTLMETQEAIGN